MVPKTPNKTPPVTNGPTQSKVTLRDVHDRSTCPREKAALRRLEQCLGRPLEHMPGDRMDWFDTNFPPVKTYHDEGVPSYVHMWSSALAYRRWHTVVRRTILRHPGVITPPIAPLRLVQARHISHTIARYHSALPAEGLIHRTAVDRVLSYYADFRRASNEPTSD